MADVVLIVTMTLFSMLIILASIYFLAYFQHPEDKNVAWYPKIVVVLSICIACYDLFLLPLDVANQAGQISASGGIPMPKLSLAFSILTVIFAIWIIPFTIFFYEGLEESDDGEGEKGVASQFKNAFKWMLPTAILSVGLLVGLYFTPGVPVASVPATLLTGNFNDDALLGQRYNNFLYWSQPNYPSILCSNVTAIVDSIAYSNALGVGVTFRFFQHLSYFSSGTFNVKVSGLVFTIAIFSFVGWILFSVFGGVGLATLPIDMIADYVQRPRPIKKEVYFERKQKIGEQAGLMLESGRNLMLEIKAVSRSGKLGAKYQRVKNKENEFRKDSLILEYHYRRNEESFKNAGGDALWQILQLVGGILAAILSLCWFLQVVLYVGPIMWKLYPISPFLNDMLNLTKDIPFIGTLLYAIFSFYLLACVFKGNLKIGMNLVFMTLHPMVMGDTTISSILFNVGIVLMTALPVVHFCTVAFSGYATLTASASLFTVQIQMLNNLSDGFKALVGIFLFLFGASFLFNIYKPPYKQKGKAEIQFKY